MTAPAPLSEGLDLPLHEQQPQGQSTNIYYLKLKYKVTMKDSTDQPFFFYETLKRLQVFSSITMLKLMVDTNFEIP